MKWLDKLFGTENHYGKDNNKDLIQQAIEKLMSTLCDLDQCMPYLRSIGMDDETIWRVYNLTVLACADDALKKFLSEKQIPHSYFVLTDQGEHEVAFKECDIYMAAKKHIYKYGDANFVVATHSAPFQAMNSCFNELGDNLKEDISLIEILPARLPKTGQAITRARIN